MLGRHRVHSHLQLTKTEAVTLTLAFYRLAAPERSCGPYARRGATGGGLPAPEAQGGGGLQDTHGRQMAPVRAYSCQFIIAQESL